jgi:hypothetical protein
MYLHFSTEGRHWAVDKEAQHVMFTDHDKSHMLEALEYKDIHFGWEVVKWVAVNQLCVIT